MKRDWKLLLAVFLISFSLKTLGICHAPEQDREQIVSRGERYVVMELTAYTEHFNSTGKNPGDAGWALTASGERVRRGIVAADWNVLPKDSVVYIEGLGIFEVKDRGGAINGDKIDVYVESENEAIKFGRQWRKVFILRIGGDNG